MPDIYHYIVPMPDGLHGASLPDTEGNYTVYTNCNDTHERRLQAYKHELEHIKNGDFEKSDVQEIESEAHR